MLIEGVTLASYGLVNGGGAVGNLLYQLENMGFFDYVLPFLMIFAIVFAILEKIGFLGDKKAINVILALAVALMALQFQFVSYFFSEIFPRLGVLLSIILVAIILLSLFLDFESPTVKVVIGGLMFIGFIVIVLQSFSSAFPWSGDILNGPFWWWLQDNLSIVIVVAIVVGGFIAMVKGPSDPAKKAARKARLQRWANETASKD